ncbi:peptide-methionine (S)-S-oxide reductase MsrA [Pseudohaliea rubra]|uniref:Peptide methionine sulfoxide reductase MsrA n=1 Tax=Pseudohaliea rubra DSM 19751 TaxID=1265313 RepID=A0A095XZD5_9GAMM|nr:peptide-methionine (S)-S-oxide reductase MsrA [Pseudohaliea rubra]KGE05106.1 Peptide methionine sulfoxide reductase MsrA [Pseudohaliea rubra DSM 19751]
MTRLPLALLVICLTALAPGTRAAEALFAGGCFWCMEADFEKLEGVSEVVSGFTGGTLRNPSYRGNHEGHYEAVRVSYDPAVVSYEALLEHFWHNIDPFDNRGQFCDKGPSYRTAIFATDEQRPAAEASFAGVRARFPAQDIATELLPAGRFWPVEAYHQDYAEKNPLRYKYYRWNCGRDQRLEEIWGEGEDAH